MARLGVGTSGSDPGGVVNGGATSGVLGKKIKCSFSQGNSFGFFHISVCGINYLSLLNVGEESHQR